MHVGWVALESSAEVAVCSSSRCCQHAVLQNCRVVARCFGRYWEVSEFRCMRPQPAGHWGLSKRAEFHQRTATCLVGKTAAINMLHTWNQWDGTGHKRDSHSCRLITATSNYEQEPWLAGKQIITKQCCSSTHTLLRAECSSIKPVSLHCIEAVCTRQQFLLV